MEQSPLMRDPATLVKTRDESLSLPETTPRAVAMVVAALGVGLILRLLLLGSKSFWLDEALSIRLAADPLQLWARGFDHSHPPLYYALLHYWLPFGTSEFALRLSSALVGSVAIPLAYWLALDLGGRRVAYTTAWMVALSPLLVWYAQELRSYSLLSVLGLMLAIALVRLVTRPHIGWWLLFVVAMSAALYTHYAALLLLPIQLSILAVLHMQQRLARRGLWLWLLAWPVVLLLYWPWLTAPGMRAFVGLMFTSNLYPVEILALRVGVSPTLMGLMVGVAALVVLVVALIGVGIALRRGVPAWQRLARSPWVRYGVLLLVFALTIFAVVPRLYTVKKMVVALWPYGLLLVAWLFPWQRSHRVMVALLLGVSLAGSLVNVVLIPKDQWREMVTYLAAQGEATDTIWVVPRYQGVPLNYYFDHPPHPTSTTSANTPKFSIAHVSPQMGDAELAALADKGQRVWLIYHAVDYRLDDPNQRLQRWLNEHMAVSTEIHFFRIDATLYVPRP